MTIAPSPYDLIRAIQDQQRATDRLVQMLAGMLDKSAPEPLLSFPLPAVPPAQSAPTKKLRRVVVPAGRPPAEYTLDGVTFATTERRVKILDAIREMPRGLSDLVRLGFAPRTNAMMAQILDINRELTKAGSPYQIKAQPRPPRTTGRGSIAAKYELTNVSETAAPLEAADEAAGFDSRSLAEDRCDDGSNPSAAADIGAVADRGGARRPDGGERPAARPPEATSPLTEPPAGEPKIERLAAVLVNKSQVFGPGGSVFVNTRAARILDALKHGDLFGLDAVAKKANVSTVEDCRHALRIEAAALRSIGLEVWTDKINVRLREAS